MVLWLARPIKCVGCAAYLIRACITCFAALAVLMAYPMARLVPMLSVPTTASPVFTPLKILLEDMSLCKCFNDPRRLPDGRYRTMLNDMISPWAITRWGPDARAQPVKEPSCIVLPSIAFTIYARQ